MDYKILTPKIKFGTFKIDNMDAFAYQIVDEEKNIRTSIAIGLYDKIDELILKNIPDNKLLNLYFKITEELLKRGLKVNFSKIKLNKKGIKNE